MSASFSSSRLLKFAIFSLASISFCAVSSFAAAPASGAAAGDATRKGTLTGQAAFTDYLHEKPGVRRHVTAADLPAPDPSESVDNGPHLVPRPEGMWPIAP